jgi:hypothetical protein
MSGKGECQISKEQGTCSSDTAGPAPTEHNRSEEKVKAKQKQDVIRMWSCKILHTEIKKFATERPDTEETD